MTFIPYNPLARFYTDLYNGARSWQVSIYLFRICEATMQRSKNLEWLRNLFLLLILIVLIAGDWAGALFIRFFIIPAIVSLVAGSIVESATGGTLTKISLIIKIGPFTISISAFAIAVLILRFIWF
jgi:hypothetical protein